MRGLVLSIGGAALLVIASVGPATADPAGLCETLARVSKIEVPREQHEGVFKGVLDLFDCPVPWTPGRDPRVGPGHTAGAIHCSGTPVWHRIPALGPCRTDSG